MHYMIRAVTDEHVFIAAPPDASTERKNDFCRLLRVACDKANIVPVWIVSASAWRLPRGQYGTATRIIAEYENGVSDKAVQCSDSQFQNATMHCALCGQRTAMHCCHCNIYWSWANGVTEMDLPFDDKEYETIMRAAYTKRRRK
jgi:hypothetical protein